MGSFKARDNSSLMHHGDRYSSISHQNLQDLSFSRNTSVVSLASLDLNLNQPEEQMGMTGLSAVRDILLGQQGRNIRIGPLIHFILISCLLFGTLSDVVFKMGSGNSTKSSTNGSKSRIFAPAMISSVTDYLSPILPFTGGIDLRKDSRWKSWRNYLWLFGEQNQNQTSNNIHSKILIPRGGALGKSKNSITASHNNIITLSTSEPFLSIQDIEEMTLREISYTFHYMVEASKEDFELESFLSSEFDGEPINVRMEKAVRSMEEAVEKSRGQDVLPPIFSLESSEDTASLEEKVNGNIDALRFCAVMRILAEWRVLRQVPPGYKGYAVGMSLGHKDVVQNVAKIETAVHEWIESRGSDEATCNNEICVQRRSPTLRQLLQFEIENDVHPNSKLPKLKEKSSAMGLLWTRRQLHYQTAVFDNIIGIPKSFPAAIDAVGAAYSEVYGKLHGWAVQKIFNYSFQSAPNAEEIFKHMNPRRLRQVKEEVKSGISANIQTDTSTSEANENEESLAFDSITKLEKDEVVEEPVDGKNANPFIQFFDNVGKDLNRLGKHIGNEWDKVSCSVSNIFKAKKDDVDCDDKGPLIARGGGNNVITSNELSSEDTENYITTKMTEDAKEHIITYLKIAKPVLDDLANLFDEMNMDDPTKV